MGLNRGRLASRASFILQYSRGLGNTPTGEIFRDSPKEFDFCPPGEVFQSKYAKFIANKNIKLGSAKQLADLRKSLAT